MALEPLVGTHQHTQDVAATSWVITHNLNTTEPVVDCWIGGEKVIPQTITATSALVCTITFPTAQVGKATLV